MWGAIRPVGGFAVRGPPGRGADRTSAFQAVPAILPDQRFAISLRFAQRCRPEVGVPLPARHERYQGSRREESHPERWGPSRRPPAAGCAGPHRENWPEVGVPFPARHQRYQGPRREGSHPERWGPSRRPPAAGCADRRSAFPFLRVTSAARVRAERRAMQRCAISRPSGPRCRSEDRRSLSARVPPAFFRVRGGGLRSPRGAAEAPRNRSRSCARGLPPSPPAPPPGSPR